MTEVRTNAIPKAKWLIPAFSPKWTPARRSHVGLASTGPLSEIFSGVAGFAFLLLLDRHRCAG